MATYIFDHKRQLERMKDDIGDIASNAYELRKLSILNWVMVVLEVSVILYAAYDWWHRSHPPEMAIGVEIIILVIHALAMSVEKRLHQSNDNWADRLQDELQEKADDVRSTAKLLGQSVSTPKAS
jgi:cytochrome c-type biogenesis protein CcmH/NrfG